MIFVETLLLSICYIHRSIHIAYSFDKFLIGDGLSLYFLVFLSGKDFLVEGPQMVIISFDPVLLGLLDILLINGVLFINHLF